MQGSSIILSLFIAIAATSARSTEKYEPLIRPRDFDYEKTLLDRVHEENCGYIKNAISLLMNNDVFDNHSEFNGIKDVFDDIYKISECKAVVSGEQIWVRVASSNENRQCQLYVPYNAINLLHPDSEKYPHVNREMFVQTFGTYSKCEDIEVKIKEDRLNPVEEEAIAINYVRSILTPAEVDDIEGLDQKDKVSLVDEITKSSKMPQVLGEVDGLSEEGQIAVKKYVTDKLSDETIEDLRLDELFKLEVEKIEKNHHELIVKEPTGLQAESEEPREEAHIVNTNGQKLLNPSQINETATYCNEHQIQRVVSLYKVLANLGKLKSIKIWEQNVVECIVGHDDTHFKAVLEFNNNACLFDVVLDLTANEVSLTNSLSVGLQACHEKPLFK